MATASDPPSSSKSLPNALRFLGSNMTFDIYCLTPPLTPTSSKISRNVFFAAPICPRVIFSDNASATPVKLALTNISGKECDIPYNPPDSRYSLSCSFNLPYFAPAELAPITYSDAPPVEAMRAKLGTCPASITPNHSPKSAALFILPNS